jgi:hypothetical protein
MKFSVEESINQVKEEDKKSYMIISFTMNPNIVDMNDKELGIFKMYTKNFFKEDIFKSMFSSDITDITSIGINYQIEKGEKMKAWHIQGSFNVEYKKGRTVLMDFPRIKEYFGKFVKMVRPDREKPTIHLEVKMYKDHYNIMKQYVKKK